MKIRLGADAGRRTVARPMVNWGVFAFLLLLAVLVAEPLAIKAASTPGAPTNLQAVSIAEGIKLTWSVPAVTEEATGYRILRRRPLEGEPSLLVYVKDTGTTATEYIDSNVEDGITYVYRVMGLSGTEAGPRSSFVKLEYTQPLESSEASDNAADQDSPPDKPVKVFAKVIQGSVQLTWEPDPDNATGYQILRRSPTKCESTLLVFVQDTGSTDGQYLDTDVEHGHRYVYRVKAINQHGLSKSSDFTRISYNDKSFVGKSGPAGGSNLNPPNNMSATAIEGAVLLEWAPAEGATAASYRIMRRVPAQCQENFLVHVSDTGNAGTTYLDEDVVMGERYIYRIVAVNQDGFSDVSAASRVTVTPSVPAMITTLSSGRNVRPGAVDATVITASNLPLDDDPDTLDYTIRIDAMTLVDGEPDADANSCEGDGMGESHQFWTVESANLDVVYAFDDECATGEYRVKAILSDSDGKEVLSLSFNQQV